MEHAFNIMDRWEVNRSVRLEANLGLEPESEPAHNLLGRSQDEELVVD